MTLAVVLPTFLTFQAGDSDGYMTLGLLSCHPRAVQPADTYCGQGVRPSAGHPRRAQPLHRLLRPAQEPPVPPLLLVFVVTARRSVSR